MKAKKYVIAYTSYYLIIAAMIVLIAAINAIGVCSTEELLLDYFQDGVQHVLFTSTVSLWVPWAIIQKYYKEN